MEPERKEVATRYVHATVMQRRARSQKAYKASVEV